MMNKIAVNVTSKVSVLEIDVVCLASFSSNVNLDVPSLIESETILLKFS